MTALMEAAWCLENDNWKKSRNAFSMTTVCQWEVWSHTGRVHWIVKWKEVIGIDSRNEKRAEWWDKLLSSQ